MHYRNTVLMIGLLEFCFIAACSLSSFVVVVAVVVDIVFDVVIVVIFIIIVDINFII